MPRSVPPRRLIHLQHTAWGEEAGIPVAGISFLQRSGDGYLWLGTVDGLLRFDGVRFVMVDGSRVPALRSSVAGPMEPVGVDRRGALWIHRRDGALVEYFNGAFRIALGPDTTRSWLGASTFGGDGTLWVNARGLVAVRHGQRVRLSPPRELQGTASMGIAADTGAGVWVGTRSGQLWHVTERVATQVEYVSESGDGIRPLLQSRDGALWLLDHGIVRWKDGVRTRVMVPGTAVIPTGTWGEELPDGSVIIGTRGHGVLRWSNGIVDQFSVAEGLSNAIVRALLVDRDGTIWLTTDAGLDRLRRTPFVTLGARDGLTTNYLGAVISDAGGGVWIDEYSTRRTYLVDSGPVRQRDGPLAISQAVRPRADGDIHVTVAPARGGGAYQYDYRGHLLLARKDRSTVIEARGLPRLRPRAVYETRAGDIWIGFDRGQIGVLRNGVYAELRGFTRAGRARATAITEDARHHIWITTRDPGLLVEVVGDSVRRQFAPAENASAVLKNPLVDQGDTIWMATGDRLLRLANDTLVVAHLPGLVAAMRDPSYSMLIAAKHLWVCSALGIGRISMTALNRIADGDSAATAPLQWFGQSDGLPMAKGTIMNAQACTTGPDARLWFSTPVGVAVLDPASLADPAPPPRVHIEEVIADGKPLAIDPVLRIPPNPERVEFKFTATELRLPERTNLQYRLDGADGVWIDVRGARSATYTQLRPGKYQFRVRAWLDGGAPGSAVTLALRVLPAWYQSWWFALPGRGGRRRSGSPRCHLDAARQDATTGRTAAGSVRRGDCGAQPHCP